MYVCIEDLYKDSLIDLTSSSVSVGFLSKVKVLDQEEGEEVDEDCGSRVPGVDIATAGGASFWDWTVLSDDLASWFTGVQRGPHLISRHALCAPS
jgi:hypothetical protein